jgi:hypothetical protein
MLDKDDHDQVANQEAKLPIIWNSSLKKIGAIL